MSPAAASTGCSTARRGRPHRAARLVEALARAIAEAHRKGLVHRDLKPANILLEQDGTPKIADFGLAKILDSDGGLTKTQAILGSPSYMAPEQAEGRSDLIGPATDVYALGAILYVLLTGRPPFKAATPLETMSQVKSTEPVPPSRFQPGLPRDIETICLKCLEKTPSRRYTTALALAEDLRRYQLGEPILARPARAWERAVEMGAAAADGGGAFGGGRGRDRPGRRPRRLAVASGRVQGPGRSSPPGTGPRTKAAGPRRRCARSSGSRPASLSTRAAPSARRAKWAGACSGSPARLSWPSTPATATWRMWPDATWPPVSRISCGCEGLALTKTGCGRSLSARTAASP